MRLALICAAGIMVAGIAYAQDPESSDAASLLDALAKESTIAYRIDRDANLYQMKLISDELAQESRSYYANRSANVAEYWRLDKQRKSVIERQQLQIARTGAVDPADTAIMKEIETRMKKAGRPTGYYRVGEITRRGSDFIGIRELGSETEFLVPLDRILHVSVPPRDGLRDLP